MQKLIILNRFWILLIILTLGFLVFYIFQLVLMSEAEFLVAGCEKETKEISESNKALEISFSQINSLKNINDLAERLNFKKVKNIHYIKVAETFVAKTK